MRPARRARDKPSLLAVTLASVAVLLVTIGIVLFYRRDGGWNTPRY